MTQLLKFVLFITTLVASVHVFASHNKNDHFEEVSLQLNWAHQFRFAGYYMAIEKGYYAENGLKLNLLEAKVASNSIDTL